MGRAHICQTMRGEQAQSTLEYVLVLSAFLAMVLALGALAGALHEGVFSERGISAASHLAEGGIVATLKDISLF